MSKIRIAIIKFGGLFIGGSERFLQVVAANLPRDQFDVDYYYCDAAPYFGSAAPHGDTNSNRLKYMQDHGVHLVKFNVRFRDLTKPTFDWIGTDFWDLFDENHYDLVLTVKSGHPEYPFHLLKIPVVECIVLPGGIDSRPVFHIHPSQYMRKVWFKMGGNLDKSGIVPLFPSPPSSSQNLRMKLNIPDDGIVAGFHQRADNAIFSPIPLKAFSRCCDQHRYFIILGGGQKYRDQAIELSLKNVRFLPETGDSVQISQFLNTLDIFAHGRGDGETFGTVFAEAMLHGKPCLSHAVSEGDNAQPETMGPGGLFAANQEEYTKMLRQLFLDNHLRQKLSQKAITHAQEYYSFESSIEELTQIFQKISGRPVSSTQKQRIPYGISPLGFLYAGYLDHPSQIAYHVLTGDIPEEFYVEIVRFFLPQVRTFIDIGANTGLYGLLAAKECPTETMVHCFEPQKECCQILEKTIQLNNWEEKAFVHPFALSNQSGEFPFYLADSGSSFDPAFNRSASQIKTKVDTLDHCIRDLGISDIDFIKIDVECHEQKVLEGAIDVLSTYRPMLFVEIMGNWKKNNYLNSLYPQTISWLQSHGYAVYRCTEQRGRFWHFGTISKVTNNRTPNNFYMFLCIPCEKESLVVDQLKQRLKNVNKQLMKKRMRTAKQKAVRVLKEKFKRSSFYPFMYKGRNVITRSLKQFSNLISQAQ